MSGQDSQRIALEGTVPTTEVIKDAVTFPRERLGEPLDISPERFESWLAQVRRDTAREALLKHAAELTETADLNDGYPEADRWLFAADQATLAARLDYPEVTP